MDCFRGLWANKGATHGMPQSALLTVGRNDRTAAGIVPAWRTP